LSHSCWGTSDSLAHDTTDYSQFGNLLSGYHEPSKGVFFTGELQDAFSREPKIELSEDPVTISQAQQYKDLFHVDIAKWVAGFSIRHTVGGNAAAAAFQGVAESRASQTTQQELDLEATTRMYRDVRWKFPFSIGNQTVLEYDRSVQGNLSQKPINANYSLNDFSTNLFFQKRIPFFWDAATTQGNWANRELPRTLIVLTPIQYQQQVVGSFLFFSNSVGNGQLTVPLPRAYGYSSRIGLRHEIAGGSWWKADRGSYFEAGFQLASQYNVLQSVTLFTGAVSLTCNANGIQTIPQCFGANKQFPIDSTTTPSKSYYRQGGNWSPVPSRDWLVLGRTFPEGPVENIRTVRHQLFTRFQGRLVRPPAPLARACPRRPVMHSSHPVDQPSGPPQLQPVADVHCFLLREPSCRSDNHCQYLFHYRKMVL